MRLLAVAFMSWAAEQERTRLGERVCAGVDRAREQGFSFGRPVARVDLARATQLRAG
jgi:DNA invertase Pin-like site-specific DNA recombinase